MYSILVLKIKKQYSALRHKLWSKKKTEKNVDIESS